MEKITFQASYTKISLYAQASAASSAKKAGDRPGCGDAPGHAADDKGGPGEAGRCRRNKDGDTFTLSIEAQSIQISGTMLIDDSGRAQLAGRKPGEAPGVLSGAAAVDGSEADRIRAELMESFDLPSDVHIVNAFLDAMKRMDGKGRHGREERQLHSPQLGDPQDVADRLLEHLGREHAEKGGSRAELADGVRRRLSDWEPSTTRISVKYQEFRSEVHLKMTSGLDAWVASGGDSATG